ncbi:methylated-DNA--[protein]-cysteine S-methyltransferase [Microbacterium pseudoresistens]|uniref:Methylated-DNA-[protein]-cysteine S-methyltransferase n=1 Tax=Microbacterium pseudoresistens TaxID=640634 RepID=A0A7Y9ESW2_9MICO|nr:methylated-DNA--[protein]-cysteine S-methyltransferase [Microbacterium pseudoresistens]NYD53357.1 methylated-DNA-[protein]-cysteine S-methyltransferase [Microbacterium pseudoresistens]
MTFHHDILTTPFSPALAVFSDEGLVALELTDEADLEAPWLLEGLSRRLGAVIEADPGCGEELQDLLESYFEGEPVRFDERVRLDWRLVSGFALTALQAICEIPWGETAAYGEIAVHAGSPGAARAVGSACRTTPFSIVVPVHRVVRSDGSPGQYGAHPERKRYLIDLEADAHRRRRNSAGPGE